MKGPWGRRAPVPYGRSGLDVAQARQPLQACERYRRGSGGSPMGCSSEEAKAAHPPVPPARLL